MSDARLEALIELEDIARRLWDLKHRLGLEIRQEQERHEDAQYAAYPVPRARVEAPSDGHPPLPAHICAEACDDVD